MDMHCILIYLVCIIFSIVIKGVSLQLPILIDDDATELTRLGEKFWSLKPAVFQTKGPLALCEFVDECCTSQDRSKAISLMVTTIVNRYPYTNVINICMKSNEKNQSCSSLQKLLYSTRTKQDKSIALQYIQVILDYISELRNLIDAIDAYCNDEEIHAFLCLSNTKLVKICAGKILQGIYDKQGYAFYEEFLTECKQTLNSVNEELSEVF